MSPSSVRINGRDAVDAFRCQPPFVNEPQPAAAFADEDVAVVQERRRPWLCERVGDHDDADTRPFREVYHNMQ
jgi:hypothetical protein